MSDFSELVQAFDVEDYLSATTKLRRSGPTNMMATPCPICGDRRTSKFYVNTSGSEHNGRFNSYCCHEVGNLVKLVKTVEGFSSDSEAIAMIISTVEGTDSLIPLVAAGVAGPAPLPELLAPAPLYSATAETPCVIKGRLGRLSDRGIDDYIIKRHQLLATGTGTLLGGSPRRYLDNRLFIPVWSGDGTKLWSWQARDLTGAADRKYVFPEGDRSAETFYGLHEYLARGGDTLMICEGAPAKWAWDGLGRFLGSPELEFRTVASFGKKLTAAQEGLLMTIDKVKRVIIAWDDDAGPQIARVAGKLSGRKEIWVLPAHESGADHDELAWEERAKLLCEAKPFSLEVVTKMAMRHVARKHGILALPGA